MDKTVRVLIGEPPDASFISWVRIRKVSGKPMGPCSLWHITEDGLTTLCQLMAPENGWPTAGGKGSYKVTKTAGPVPEANVCKNCYQARWGLVEIQGMAISQPDEGEPT